ncbi:hypothetical protein [Bifidobacterium tsurumiense]|uniref:hypothetical protein n=1 Tax=Bifidobacterium tsurumiense TaxID=356829 RepID=UPI00047AD814|nr:hypothetical protein [Bifidobacterium tsurumiense]
MTDNARTGGPGFMLALEARATGPDEPDLNTAIAAARDEYRDGDADARRMWSDAAAHDWDMLCADPVTRGEWASDVRRLAILATVFEAVPERAERMILTWALDPDEPSRADMRGMLGDERPVDFDRLLDDLTDGACAYAPGDDLLADRIGTASNVLGPIAENAPDVVAYAITSLKAAFTLAQGDLAEAMDLIAFCRPHLDSTRLADAVEAQARARAQSGGDGMGMGMAMGGPTL